MKNLVIKKLVGFSIFGLMIFGCAYNVKENPVDTTSKDTTVKYSEVSSVLENKCYGCHIGGSGGQTFKDYSSLKTYLQKDSTLFINSIVQNGKASPMPQGGKLKEDEIQKILAWIRQGLNP
jgi:hypothetical protein